MTWTIFKPRKDMVRELFVQARKPSKCMFWLIPETLFYTVLSLFCYAIWLYVLLKILSIRELFLKSFVYFILLGDFDIAFLQKSPTRMLGVLSAPIIDSSYPSWIVFAVMYHFAGFMWGKAVLSDAQKLIVAHATSTWYFGEGYEFLFMP